MFLYPDRILMKFVSYSLTDSARILVWMFPHTNRHITTISRLLRHQRETIGSIEIKQESGRKRTARTEQNIGWVRTININLRRIHTSPSRMTNLKNYLRLRHYKKITTTKYQLVLKKKDWNDIIVCYVINYDSVVRRNFPRDNPRILVTMGGGTLRCKDGVTVKAIARQPLISYLFYYGGCCRVS